MYKHRKDIWFEPQGRGETWRQPPPGQDLKSGLRLPRATIRSKNLSPSLARCLATTSSADAFLAVLSPKLTPESPVPQPRRPVGCVLEQQPI